MKTEHKYGMTPLQAALSPDDLQGPLYEQPRKMRELAKIVEAASQQDSGLLTMEEWTALEDIAGRLYRDARVLEFGLNRVKRMVSKKRQIVKVGRNIA